MTVSSPINQTYRLLIASGLAGVMLLFAACASTPMPPTALLTEAEVAIQSAEKDDASRYAAAELDEARQKLIHANKAVVSEDMQLAEQLAQESIVTAQLAAARAEATKAKAVNEEVSRGIKALKEEMQRTGEQQ